jgi:hypothetical protein
MHDLEPNDCYPKDLRDAEKALLEQRPNNRAKTHAVGVGLSGGGIRSATFCLGFFQALSHLKLLGKVDYLSTVSGGGYFGSFLGRLFSRDYIKDHDDLDHALNGPPPDALDQGAKAGVLPWLRENGRYLSPRGSGDLLSMIAVILRNWLALHVTLVSTVLLAAFALVAARSWLEARTAALPSAWRAAPLCVSSEWGVWFSPFWVVAAAIFLLVAFPGGWAYWLVGWPTRASLGARAWVIAGWVGKVLVPALTAAAFAYHASWPSLDVAGPKLTAAGFVFVAVASLLIIGFRVASLFAGRARPGHAAPVAPREIPPVIGVYGVGVVLVWLYLAGWRVPAVLGGLVLVGLVPAWIYGRAKEATSDSQVYRDAVARNHITSWLRWGLVATAVILGVTLVDSVAESLYRGSAARGGIGNNRQLGALVALLSALTAPAAKLPALLGARRLTRGGSLLKAGLSVLACLIVLVLLTGGFWLAHATRWHFAGAPGAGAEPTEAGRLASDLTVAPDAVRLVVTPAHVGLPKKPPSPTQPDAAPHGHVETLVVTTMALLLFALLFGGTWTFLNGSSQLPFYMARLARAYLGASNRTRLRKAHGPDGGDRGVSEVERDDDVDILEYFGLSPYKPGSTQQWSSELFTRGAPLHLINVTINETHGGRSQIEQQDRKGLGMSVGPCGMSAGRDQHLVFDRSKGISGCNRGDRQRRIPLKAPTGETAQTSVFHVNSASAKACATMEPLTLGYWTAISGAAFSTGTGYRTSLGLSLLAGFGNIRLGYWWDSHHVSSQKWSTRFLWRVLWRVLGRVFAVQKYLLHEFLARFPGTSRQHWYLSDGGHFENLGGYELIRRRLPFIVLVDAEADPDFEFQGLANLVRKARIDFGAEVQFLGKRELDVLWPDRPSEGVGTLEQLVRGAWEADEGPSPSDGQPRKTLEKADHLRDSHTHAALALVTYRGSDEWSLLLYVKASLTGDESLDLRQYHRAHPAFPHEPTSDQFFDEAQWESYRRLGEHIAETLFGTDGAQWTPRRFDRPQATRWTEVVNKARSLTTR